MQGDRDHLVISSFILVDTTHSIKSKQPTLKLIKGIILPSCKPDSNFEVSHLIRLINSFIYAVAKVSQGQRVDAKIDYTSI